MAEPGSGRDERCAAGDTGGAEERETPAGLGLIVSDTLVNPEMEAAVGLEQLKKLPTNLANALGADGLVQIHGITFYFC